MRLSVTAALLASLAACEQPAPPNEIDPIPASAELRAIERSSWLVRRVTFERARSEGVGSQTAAGLDVDRVDTGNGDPRGRCDAYAPDLVSFLDPGIVGIDNAAQSLIPTGEHLTGSTFEEALDTATREGRVRWAISIGELEGDDLFLPLDLHVVEQDQVIAYDASGMPAAGQRLRARRIAETVATVRRSVAFGRASTSELTVSGGVMLLPFHDLEVAGFAVAAGSSSEVLSGTIGGSFSVAELLAVTDRDVSTTSDRSFARGLFEASADLNPSAEEPHVCERVSVGFGLEAVPVELVID